MDSNTRFASHCASWLSPSVTWWIAGHDWTEAPSYKVNQPCGDSSCSFLEDTTSGCFDVREHEVIKKYIATEKENESFTLMIVYGVKAEYLTVRNPRR